jgi:hypothetical protein
VFRRGPMRHCLSPQPGARRRTSFAPMPPGAGVRPVWRHKTLCDRRKPQKEDGLPLYENFVRISRLASPTATRCIPSGHHQCPAPLWTAVSPGHVRNRLHW